MKTAVSRTSPRLVATALVLAWSAFCGLRYWLKQQRVADCEHILYNVPANAPAAAEALRCATRAIESRDGALLWAIGLPLVLALLFSIVIWFARAKAGESTSTSAGGI